MPRLRSVFGPLALFASLFAGSAAHAQKAAPQLLPYNVTAIAGGATTSPAAGTPCAAGSTLVSTDSYGDGCLATQVALGTATGSKGKLGPQYVTADDLGNVFFSDTQNGLVRRISARTGIITTVAGGASASPAAGTACGAFTSTDVLGDGCLATAVKLATPEGLAVSPITGELFFADSGTDTVRKILANGTVALVAGSSTNTYGYAVNSAAGNIVASSGAGYLNFVYGIAFTPTGNLIIADEGNNAVLGLNLSASTVTIANVAIPPGTIAKLIGYGDRAGKTSSGDCPQFTSTTARGGCYFGSYTEGATALTSQTDAPYDVSVDPAGNIFFANEFNTAVARIATNGTVTTAIGTSGKRPVGPARGPATTTAIGSDYALNVDSFGNVYVADSTAGLIWRTDAANGGLYVLAGGASSVCAAATDSFGDGCPAPQTRFSTLSTSPTAYATTPGVQGLYADHQGNLYAADSVNLLIRKLSTGAQFPALAAGKSLTQSIQIHYGAGDTQGTYTLPTAGTGSGAVDFTLGTATCTTNSDSTQDCVLPVTFTPSAAGVRTAALVAKSTSGLSSSFALTGIGNAALLLTDSSTNTGVTTLPGGPYTAISALAGNTADILYAASPSGVQRIAAGKTTSLSTASNATAVATDPAGNVYAALSSGSIVEFPATGAAQLTLATGFTTPSGLATDALGNLFVADSAANTVTRIAAATLTQRVVATGLSGPTGLAVDLTGNLFIANTLANNVIEVPVSGAAPITLGIGLAAPRAVATGAAGALYVADTRNARVVFIPNENGTLNSADQLTVATAGLGTPSGVLVTAAGILYVADSTANTISVFNRNTATQLFGNDPTGTQLAAPADIVSAGNLPVTFSAPYTSATGNTADFSLTPTTGPTTLAPGFGVALTAGFKPTGTGPRQAVYTFAATNTAAPTLTLTGTGITPVNATTTTLSANPATGTYGQTVALTVTVSTPAGQPTATGSVNVTVDAATSTAALINGTVTLPLTGLSAGTHTIGASYSGDSTSNPSTATPITVTLAKANLTVAVNSASNPYLAPLPTFTGTTSGTVNNDSIAVSYATTATQTSPLGQYPITATVGGNAATNYNVTVTPGSLTITAAGTSTVLSASGTSVSASTPVTLTATVASATSGTPTGSVRFYNGQNLIATVALTNGSATTSFLPPVGPSSLTAVYSGDGNYTTSTSAALLVTASTPGFSLTGTAAALSVVQGQTGLTTFTLTPTFGYTGTINFSCANLPATVNCIFSPTSIAASSNTSSLVAVTFTTVQPGGLAAIPTPAPSRLVFAALPLFALCCFRRKRLSRSLIVLFAGALTLGVLSGCGSGHFATPTPTGTYNIAITATGTPATGTTTPIVQTFTVALTVK